MTEQNPNQPASLPASRRFLPLLLVLFVGSGCAALIYEIVWFQLLQLVIGSSAVSLGVLLGTFMGGMCLGSLPCRASSRRGGIPCASTRLLELGIGVIGIAVLFGMPYVGRLYTANVGHGLAGILLRGVVCAVCLLPPTLLMGATLPAIARWVETTPQRRFLAGLLLRRQHRRGRVRLPAGGVLSAARPRHGDGDLRRRGDQRGRGSDRPRPGGHDAASRRRPAIATHESARSRRAPGRCMSRSRCPGCARWAPR